MSRKNIQKVLLITGFAPVKLPQLVEMGIPTGPIHFLSGLAGKDTLRLSIPTVGPAVLGSYLKKQGLDVAIVDHFQDEAMPAEADLVGISSTFMGVEDVAVIAARARQTFPVAVITLGGPLSWSVPPEELLTSILALDCVVLREGEEVFSRLIRALNKGTSLTRVPNLAYRSRGKIAVTEQRDLPAAEILTPDWSLMGLPNAKRLPVLPVETSRGCPFNCAYCSEVTYWGKPVRYREIESVVAELKQNVEKYGITTFRFTDSCFSAPPERAGELCDAIYEGCIKKGVPVKWSSYARVSNLSRTLLEKMKRAGCVALDIGVESGSERMLRAMGRHYAPSAALEVAETARELGIITNFNVVIGFPGETRESVLETAALIDRAAPDTYSCFLFYLASHTRVDRLTEEYQLTGHGLCWQHETMNSDEAAEGMRFIEKTVTSAANLPGGEYFACYLASLGFTVPQIQSFYRGVAQMKDGADAGDLMSKLTGLVESIRDYL